MGNDSLFTKEELIEKFEFVEDVDLVRGIKVDSEHRLMKGLVREFMTKDQMSVENDRRAKGKDVMMSALLIQKIFYIEVEEDQYRNLTFKEIESLRGSDQNTIVKKMQELSGESENL